MTPQQHRCDVCGKQGMWTESWSWYGSHLDIEADPTRLLKFCSDTCVNQIPNPYRALQEKLRQRTP